MTRGKKNIRYGRVEVVAKMPVGDWLWPAIWMMPEPVDNTTMNGGKCLSMTFEGGVIKFPFNLL